MAENPKEQPSKGEGKSKRGRKKRGWCLADRPVLEANAAGIDLGARELYVAVPPDRDAEPVRRFGTFTEDLHRMAEWLRGCGITTVAMESTGVYWIPPFEILEQYQLRPCLVSARHMKNVPGKRTDWQECQWIQYLHSVGLLRSAFRPAAEICAVRALMRHWGDLVALSSQHVQHMHKALTQMNLQIQHVISDLSGLTGMAIVDAILGGERNPDELVKLRDPRIRAEVSVVRKSLVGHWRAEHLFTLQQSRDLYRTYQQRIVECDQELERYLKNLTPRVDPEQKPLPPDGKKHRRARRTKKMGDWQAARDLRTETYRVFGVDVMQIPGLEKGALLLFSEVGRDLSPWPSAHHFASWCGLCPDNDRSGGQVLWTGVRRIKSRVGQLFRLAAHSLHHSLTPRGHYLRRLRARLGPRAAITATAHKIAIIFYTLVRQQVEYDESIWARRDAERQRRHEANLRRQAKQLGYQLVPLPETPAA